MMNKFVHTFSFPRKEFLLQTLYCQQIYYMICFDKVVMNLQITSHNKSLLDCKNLLTINRNLFNI